MPDIFVRDAPKEPEVITEDSISNEDLIIKKDPLENVIEKSVAPLLDVEKRRPHFLASYCIRPEGIKLTEKFDREELLLFLRKHFVTNVPWLIIALLASLVPILILIGLSLSLFSVNIFPQRFAVIIIIFYYFFIFSGYMFVSFLSWFYNISVVTNERVVDIDFSSLVFENVAATKITQIEDVSYAQIGIIRSLFDYGDVKLQTAGTTSEFEFLAVPHPEKVIKIINDLIGKGGHA